MGDLIEIKGVTLGKRIQEKKEGDDPSPIPCPTCNDVLYYVVFPEYVGEMVVVCQHCGTPMGLAYWLEEDET